MQKRKFCSFQKVGSLLLAIFTWNVSLEESHAANYFLQANSLFVTPEVFSSDQFFFNISPDRSYCIESFATSGNNWAFINGLSPVDGNLNISVTQRGDTGAPVYWGFVPNQTQLARRCFITTGNPQNISTYRLQASLGFTSINNGSGILMQLNETTLFGGYNTSVTNYNFLELTNILVGNSRDAGVITGKFTVRNAITDQVLATRNFTVNAQDRIDIGIHDIVNQRSFGSITLVHNGPPGSLKGNVSQYRIIGNNPQNFEPVMQQPLLRINGLP